VKPILIFPKPNVIPRPKGKPGFSIIKVPGNKRQSLRLNSSFNLLENNFKKGTLKEDPAGYAPERTLVLETVGSVDKFYRAAKKIPGIEFMQEILGDKILPDDDFYFQNKDGEKEDTNLKGYLYLTLANHEALNKLLKYWDEYKKNKNCKFPRGLAPLKNVFDHLKSVRYWDTEDRLRESGLLDNWQERVAIGQEGVPVEIELWYRENDNAREKAEKRVRRLIQALEGSIQQVCLINDIQYHAVLASLPVVAIDSLLNTDVEGCAADIDLLRCDEVMYFRPSGQCMAPIFTQDENAENKQDDEKINNDDQEISNEPTVALLDGLPLENHEWLKDYLIIDDPDGWSEDYEPTDQKHGTSMASLIIRGDMGKAEDAITRKIYCRPIMKPAPISFDGSTRERIPDGVLPIDIIHRSVRRIFESEGDQSAVAPTVKLINLSIADPNRLFDQVMSPWSKLIDYLSDKYQVLFVISAGNNLHDIELGITNEEFQQLTPEDKEALVLKGIAASTHSRRIMSPAESINALTIAAYHHDEVADDEFYNQINPYLNRSLPSTINPISWGKKRSVKPEVLMPGGRATYRLKHFLENDPAILEILSYNSPPGQKVASPGNTGSLNSYAHTFGTSNSAALASRRLCILNETLQDLYTSLHGDALSSEYENVLLKALLCHGASIEENFDRIEELLKEPSNSMRFSSIVAKYLGYGNVDEVRIHGCLDNQATIIQCGRIKQDDTHKYKFKLPDSLNAQTVNRRLIITLAWLSPINAKSHAYRKAHLFYVPVTGDKANNYLDIQNRELDWQMVRNGTVQHEVLSGERATAYASGTHLEIDIQCKGQAEASKISVPYGLVVTLDTPDADLPIYEEVKAGIESQFAVHVEQEKTPV